MLLAALQQLLGWFFKVSLYLKNAFMLMPAVGPVNFLLSLGGSFSFALFLSLLSVCLGYR